MRRDRVRMKKEDYLDKLSARSQTFEGREIPSDVPMAPPVGFVSQPSMIENIRNMVRGEMLRREADAAGFETFEEADDFSVADDPVPMSGYENDAEFEPPLPPEPVPAAPETAAPAAGAPTEAVAGDGVAGPPAADPAPGAKAPASK